MTDQNDAPAGANGGRGDAAFCEAGTKRSRYPDTAINPICQAGVELAGLGYVPIPLGRDRLPLCRWGIVEPGIDPARARFDRVNAAGLAVVTAGFVVIDLDRNHADGVDGVQNFRAWLDGRTLPAGPRVRTRRGGLHLWFAQPAGVTVRPSTGRLAAGADVKAGRSLVTAPPTPGYSWLAPPVALAALPMLPDFLCGALAPPPPPLCPPAPPPKFSGERGSRYAQAALERELAGVATAPKGTRNATLNAAAFRLGQLAGGGALAAETAARALLVAAAHAGLDQAEAAATIASGLRAGAVQPRGVLDAR